MEWLAIGLSAIPGVAALIWNVISWQRSGPRVTVSCENSLPMYEGQPGDWHVTVTAVNSGRAPTTVEGWGIRLPGGGDIVVMTPVPWSTPLPHRLEAKASASFHVLT